MFLSSNFRPTSDSKLRLVELFAFGLLIGIFAVTLVRTSGSARGALLTEITVPALAQKIPVGPLITGEEFAQSFTAKRNGLAAIEVLVADYGKPIRAGNIVASLRLASDLKRVLASEAVPATAVNDNHYLQFNFPVMPHSVGRRYLFTLTSQNLPPGSRFMVWLTAHDAYAGGEASINGKKQPGDMIFTASDRASIADLVWRYAVVVAASLSISAYLVIIGLAAGLVFTRNPAPLLFIAPAIGLSIVAVLGFASVVANSLAAANIAGGTIIFLASLMVLFLKRRSLSKLVIPRSVVILYVAVVLMACLITSEPKSVKYADPTDGPWRSYASMYPADGLIPYEAASVIANHLNPREFLFEPGWSITDRTHLLTVVYLHFCQFLRITPTHLPQGPSDIVDHYGFWLLRATAFATNSFFIFGLYLVGTLVLPSARTRTLALALTCLSVFVLVNASYTWPKFTCAYMLMVGAYFLLSGRFAAAGLLYGLAYWAHPMASMFGLAAFLAAFFGAANLRRSFRQALAFGSVFAVMLAATALFNSLYFHLPGGAFWMYPLDVRYHAHATQNLAVVLRELRFVTIPDLVAIRLHNFIRFLFPADLARTSLYLQPGDIWSEVKWNWLRIYGDSLWGSVGLILFPISVYGALISYSEPLCRRLIWAFLITPVIAYILWIGFLFDAGGYTTCQPIALIAMLFAARGMSSWNSRTVLTVLALISSETLFAISIPYPDASVKIGFFIVAMVIVVLLSPDRFQGVRRFVHLKTRALGRVKLDADAAADMGHP